jgi:SAM-dependent methyltransferase
MAPVGKTFRRALVRWVGSRLPQGLRTMLSSRFRRVIDRVSGADRAWIARHYLRGTGIEIGALNSPVTVPKGVKVRYVDRMGAADLKRSYPECEGIVETDIIADGERLGNLADGTQDFVVANHFLEHCQDPIGAIGHMLRVTRPSGVVYLAIPDKRYTFDRDRAVASIEHVLRDHEEGPEGSRRGHFEEWVTLVKKVSDRADAERQVDRLLAADYSIHFHVWTQVEMFELLIVLRRKYGLDFEVETFLRNGDECIFILRKE